MKSVLGVLLCSIAMAALPPPPAFTLPDNVVPIRYAVELIVDPSHEMFEGWARIETELRKPQSFLWLNATGLTVSEATVEAAGRTHKARATPVAGEFLGLEWDTAAAAGRVLVSIRYQGRFNEKPFVGPFRVQFEGNWYVFTTFTPIDARRAFPCFDEPRFKTPWELTLRVRREHQAFANARAVREEEQPGGMKAVHFAPTEPLPAEVVAFAVGPLETLDGGRAGRRGVPVRVITPKGHAAEGQETARATGEVLARLEAYTDIPYPWEKLDHIALPESAFGGTENAGLITYRLRSILRLPGKVAPPVRGLLTHELAHQWFGNLVTQATWTDVWLSEGFATWLTSRMLDKDQPPPRKRLSAVAARERIMAADAGDVTRPVRLEMKDRAGMRNVYSQFVYQKGGAVLLMLEHWLGEERFREGLRGYLKRQRFGAATTADLAEALRAASGKDPSAALHAFLDQTGIPRVRGVVRCEPDRPPRLLLEQTNVTGQWAIPVCWSADGGAANCELLDTQRREIELPQRAACPAWMYLNSGGAGYYRSEWSAAQLSTLADRGLGQLAAAERLTLVYDLRALQGNRPDLKPVFAKLAADPEPEIARAAREALAARQ